MAQTKSTRATQAQSHSSIDPLIHAAIVERQPVEVDSADSQPPRERIDAQRKRLLDATYMVCVAAKAIQDQQGCAEAHGVLRIAGDILYDVESEIEYAQRAWQPPAQDGEAPNPARGDADTAAEAAEQDGESPRGGIAELISRQLGGSEEAPRRARAGASCSVASAGPTSQGSERVPGPLLDRLMDSICAAQLIVNSLLQDEGHADEWGALRQLVQSLQSLHSDMEVLNLGRL